MSKKITLATLWLDGCSGCHMSFLDLDDLLIEVLGLVDLVYSPLMDIKEFPEMVDVTLVEGSVSTNEDIEKIQHIRQHTKFLIAFGDCAVTGNIPAMRNHYSVRQVLQHVYHDNATNDDVEPINGVPILLDTVRPIHAIVPVDLTLPGCPPQPNLIYFVLTELVAGRIPDLMGRARFG